MEFNVVFLILKVFNSHDFSNVSEARYAQVTFAEKPRVKLINFPNTKT